MFTSIQIQAQTIYKTHQTHVPKYLAHVSLFVTKLRIGEDLCMKKDRQKISLPWDVLGC